MSHEPHGDRPCDGDVMDECHRFTPVAPLLYVYSVYWDARRNDFDNADDGGVQLRIMTIIEKSRADAGTSLYCVFRNSTGGALPVLATYYEMCENHKRHMGGYILSCKVPPDVYAIDPLTPPCKIRLSPTSDPRHKMAAEFKVINTAPVTQRRDFTVCVAPLYGDIPHARIVEFMELSRLLGASHVTFYDFDLSPQTRRLIDYYVSVDRATLLPWQLTSSMDQLIWYHAQLIAVQDCLYRNMALSEYVVFMDLDEYIIPYSHADWHGLVRDIGPDVSALQVHSVFVDPYFQDKSSGIEWDAELRTLANTWRSRATSRVRTKCMVRAQLVFEAGIHHVSKPILERYTTKRVSHPVALLFHHRVCLKDFSMNCVDMVQDTVVATRYADALRQRYAQTRHDFAGYSHNGDMGEFSEEGT